MPLMLPVKDLLGPVEGTFEQRGKGDVTAKGTMADVQVDCFPQLYAALAPSTPNFVITL